MKPKEDPQDKAARLRERRMSEIEQQQAAQKQAAGLGADLRAVYKFAPPVSPNLTTAPSVFSTIGRK